MNDKVWIVMYRDYDDFSIKDVYNSKVEAEKHVKLLNEAEGSSSSIGDDIKYVAIEKSVLDKCTYKLPKYIQIIIAENCPDSRFYDYCYVNKITEFDNLFDMHYIYIKNTGLKGEELQKQIKEAIDAYVKEHLYVHS